MKGKGSMQATTNPGNRRIKTSGTVTRKAVAMSPGGVPKGSARRSMSANDVRMH